MGCFLGGLQGGAAARESCRLQTARLALELGFSCWNTFTTQPSWLADWLPGPALPDFTTPTDFSDACWSTQFAMSSTVYLILIMPFFLFVFFKICIVVAGGYNAAVVSTQTFSWAASVLFRKWQIISCLKEFQVLNWFPPGSSFYLRNDRDSSDLIRHDMAPLYFMPAVTVCFALILPSKRFPDVQDEVE